MSDGALVGDLVGLIEPCFVDWVDVALQINGRIIGGKGGNIQLESVVQEENQNPRILDSRRTNCSQNPQNEAHSISRVIFLFQSTAKSAESIFAHKYYLPTTTTHLDANVR